MFDDEVEHLKADLVAQALRLVEQDHQKAQRAVPLRCPLHLPPLHLFEQEINPATFAMARMNAVIHDLEADIRIGDAVRQPAFKDTAGQLQTFDAVVANPMWNQNFPVDPYENDPYQHFGLGVPPASSAD